MKDWDIEFGDAYPIVSNDVKLPNGSIIMFRHGDDLNALKNINLGGCLMVQGEEMCEDDFWFLIGRLRRKEGTRQLRVECNYDGHNWIYKLFNEQKIGTLITTNTFDNKENLPDDYITNLQRLPKRLQERFLYGSDADMEGVVWDEFNHALNVIDPFYIPETWKRIIVLDHGFTNPTAVIWAAIDWDGNIVIYDEHYEAGKVISYHAERIKERNNQNVMRWLIDPSCKAKTQNKNDVLRSIIEEYEEHGLHFEPADHTQLVGINKANERFKKGSLKIFKSCVNTIEEVSNWKWRKLKPHMQKNQPEEPEDKKNHTCDCIIYLVNSMPDASSTEVVERISRMSPLYEIIYKQNHANEGIYGRY